MIMFHNFVGLFLSDQFGSVIVLFYQIFKDVPRIDKPYERGNYPTHEKHYGLFLNYSIRMCIDVMKSNILDNKSHESSCEK